jgi:hypothetical protein
MTAFTVCRVAKLATPGNVGGAGAHIMRTRPTPNADAERTGSNRALVGARGADLPALVSARIKNHGVKTRKNSVPAFEMILSASPEYFRPGAPEKGGTWDEKRLGAWVDASTDWLKKKYGDRLVSAVLHLDEETPHIHAVVVPVDSKNSLNCRSFLGGRKLLSDLQTDAAQAVAHLGIERGIERSGAKHQSIKEYYERVNSPTEVVPPVLTPVPAKLGPEPEAPGVFSSSAAKAAHSQAVQQHDAEKARYESQLKKHRAEVAAANRKAHELAEKNQAQAADAKLKEKQVRQLKAENSKLGAKLEQSREDLKSLTAELRGLELVDVLQRVYGATEDAASKPTHKTRKFRLPRRSGTVAVTGELWADNATGDGGKGPINLVMQIEGWGQDRFKDAVRLLAEHFKPGDVAAAVGRRVAAQAVAQVEAAKAGPLPEVDLTHVQATWPRVRRYLTEVRRIPAALVDQVQAAGLLRSDARANAVFLREAGGGCFKRGSYDPTDRPAFKQTQGLGRTPMVLAGAPGADVWICEAPIDALSIRSIWPKATVIATGGNTNVQLLAERVQQLAADGGRVVLGHDSDAVGEAQAAKLAARLALALPGRPIVRAQQAPGVKDWNAALQKWPTLPTAGLVLLDSGRVARPEVLAAERAAAAQAAPEVATRSRQR